MQESQVRKKIEVIPILEALKYFLQRVCSFYRPLEDAILYVVYEGTLAHQTSVGYPTLTNKTVDYKDISPIALTRRHCG